MYEVTGYYFNRNFPPKKKICHSKLLARIWASYFYNNCDAITTVEIYDKRNHEKTRVEIR